MYEILIGDSQVPYFQGTYEQCIAQQRSLRKEFDAAGHVYVEIEVVRS